MTLEEQIEEVKKFRWVESIEITVDNAVKITSKDPLSDSEDGQVIFRVNFNEPVAQHDASYVRVECRGRLNFPGHLHQNYCDSYRGKKVKEIYGARCDYKEPEQTFPKEGPPSIACWGYEHECLADDNYIYWNLKDFHESKDLIGLISYLRSVVKHFSCNKLHIDKYIAKKNNLFKVDIKRKKLN